MCKCGCVCLCASEEKEDEERKLSSLVVHGEEREKKSANRN